MDVNTQEGKSRFSYKTAGGYFIPKYHQYIYSMNHLNASRCTEQIEAMEKVIDGYILQAPIHHDYIHVVNQMIRRGRYGV